MKLIIALVMLISSVAMAAEKPSYGTEIDPETKTVTLTVSNNDEAEVHCKYSVRYLVNVLTYKKQYGELVLESKGEAAVSFKNDIADHISHIHAKVSCE
jgi:hypothetical protein